MTGNSDLLEALHAIRALAQILTLDPGHRFDRTAVVLLIEREAQRAVTMLCAEERD